MNLRFASCYWALPGGLLESGESISDCAIRETAEETGITINHVVSDK
ncbi:MAG: NUDIX hydrolase [Granulosicoccus sp.]